MKTQKGYIMIQFTEKFTNISMLLRASMFTLFLLISFLTSNAQFIRINLNIPAQSGIQGLEPFVLLPALDTNSHMPTLSGTTVLSISAAENLFVLLKIYTQPPSNLNDPDKAPLQLILAWRNDGKAALPGIPMQPGTETCFPLSNSGLLIDKMNDEPSLLHAYVFITILAKPTQYISTHAMGIIYVHIEYN